ncbi:MAG: TolC family protein [Kiritimatiellia bacterium]
MKFLPLLLAVLLCAGCMHAPPREVPASPLNFGDGQILPLPENGELSLTQAVHLSLQRNPDLAVQWLEPALAAYDVQREEAGFNSVLFGGTRYGEEVSSETSRSTSERFSVEAESRESELGLRRNFSSGTELELSVSEQDDQSNRAPSQQELRAGIGLTQSLLRGRGTEVNRISIRQAQLGVDISIEELRAYTQALIAETEIAYWQLQLAQEAVEITRKALEVADQQLSEIQQRIEIGDLAPDERYAAEAERSNRRKNLTDATANLRERELILAGLLDIDPLPASPYRLRSTLELAETPIQDPAPFIEQALRLNPALREARTRLLQNELEVVRTRNGVLPRLDFFARLDKTGFGEDASSAREEFSGDTYEWVAGLELLQDLGNSEALANREQASLEREQAERAVKNMELRIINQLRRAVVEYNRTLEQAAISRETLRLRRATAEAEMARFEVGTSTSLLVAQAQREALESEIEVLELRIAYRTALVRLQELTGELLNRYGVEISRQ